MKKASVNQSILMKVFPPLPHESVHQTILRYGDVEVVVDTSDEACAKFGPFRSGDRVRDCMGQVGTVAGVGPAPDIMPAKCMVLWVLLDVYKGRGVYYVAGNTDSSRRDLKRAW